mgnify:CR=1 FL=1
MRRGIRGRTVRSGSNAIRQYQGKSSNMHTIWITEDKTVTGKLVPVAPMTLKERSMRHRRNHPMDANEPKIKGVSFRKKGYKDKKLKEFYETHVYTYIDADMNKGWIYIGGEEE